MRSTRLHDRRGGRGRRDRPGHGRRRVPRVPPDARRGARPRRGALLQVAVPARRVDRGAVVASTPRSASRGAARTSGTPSTRTATTTACAPSTSRPGRDRRIAGPFPLTSGAPGVRVGFNPGVPAIPPDSGILTGDPIRFGTSDTLSFSPLGTATPGTFYLAGDSAQAAVRVTGGSARVRLMVWRGGKWIERGLEADGSARATVPRPRGRRDEAGPTQYGDRFSRYERNGLSLLVARHPRPVRRRGPPRAALRGPAAQRPHHRQPHRHAPRLRLPHRRARAALERGRPLPGRRAARRRVASWPGRSSSSSCSST